MTLPGSAGKDETNKSVANSPYKINFHKVECITCGKVAFSTLPVGWCYMVWCSGECLEKYTFERLNSQKVRVRANSVFHNLSIKN